jgi:6-phosphogluconolactonase
MRLRKSGGFAPRVTSRYARPRTRENRAMEEIEWWEFGSAREMAEQVAGDVGFVIESAVEAHGGARIAVPGGQTPDVIYEALSTNNGIDWPKVTLIPTDDRLVRLDDPLSNYAKLNRYFGERGANLVSIVDEAALDNYREAGRLADERLAMLDWPLDLVWLGMGPCGHTASMFPGPDLDRALAGPRERRAVGGVRPDPMPADAAVERVTLTSAAIASARAVMVVVTGEEKKKVLEQAIKEGPLSSAPIGRLIADVDASIDIFWCP